MLAREKLMGIMSQNVKSYCAYCQVKDLWNGHIYCLLVPPADIPEGTHTAQLDPLKLPLRTGHQHHRDAYHIVDTADDDYAKKTGIKSLSIFLELKFIIFS